ncbi:hypothetical protein [Hyphomonas sp.]|uniref:hypothetical protein n=1 Tax=Hyphomonas sp. TaxID=87 RepID=UPI0025C517C2|nr:hypothetical protein [Hyphomonas sp.]
MDFDHILNWSLQRGSHDFPGRDGGTCINEAAIVAAGLEYREVKSADDCPPCFSKPLAAFLIVINDAMPSAERQKLLPFVMKLSGSADAPEVEARRADYLSVQIVKRVLSTYLDAAGLSSAAKRCRKVIEITDALRVVTSVGNKRPSTGVAARDAQNAASYLKFALSDGQDVTVEQKTKWAAYGAIAFADRKTAKMFGLDRPPALWSEILAITHEAFLIGNQASPEETEQIRHRLDAVRESRARPGVHA